ncbi:polyadenylate-binding protein RBP45-like [Trifolium medium]|uniref:Polyadenylate-binding protein RBP45-like n=1 Tax=Trifolium medium TaxID=97028 RepID=A0A392NA76_9FABA|nr:polyadenylate-binding protein RBP45-like [Trifolium medium]
MTSQQPCIQVCRLDPHVTEDHLRQDFSQYGELVYVKIPLSCKSGFVQFSDWSCAKEACRVLSEKYSLQWIRSTKEDLASFEHDEFLYLARIHKWRVGLINNL